MLGANVQKRGLPLPYVAGEKLQHLVIGKSRQPRCFKGWLVGCFGFNGPLKQYFSLYRAVSQREGERGEKGWRRV